MPRSLFRRKGAEPQEQSELPAGQTDVHFKIRSVSAASAWRCVECQASASLAEAMRRRDGSAWGWGHTRIKR